MNVSLMILTIFLVVHCILDLKCACLQSLCAMTCVINGESMKKNIYVHVVRNHINAMSEIHLVDEDAKLNFLIPKRLILSTFKLF